MSETQGSREPRPIDKEPLVSLRDKRAETQGESTRNSDYLLLIENLETNIHPMTAGNVVVIGPSDRNVRVFAEGTHDAVLLKLLAQQKVEVGVGVNIAPLSYQLRREHPKSELPAKIQRPPGWWFVSITQWLFSDAAYRDCIEPGILDMRVEVYRALQARQYRRARVLEWCGYLWIVRPFLAGIWKTVLALMRISGA